MMGVAAPCSRLVSAAAHCFSRRGPPPPEPPPSPFPPRPPLMKGRVLLLIVDGIGDVTVPAFGDRTPLQVARTPYLDALAAAGLNGLMDSVEPGLACGSDTAHMSILGYDPRQFYRGRGAFESMGTGLPMAPGDIAFKSNFATWDPVTNVVVKRRADRDFERPGPLLCQALDGLALPSFPQHAVSVRYATEHRCGVVVRGPGLSDAISGTDPLKDRLPLLAAQPLDASPEAAHTAAVVNELSREIHKVLAAHPVNAERQAQGLGPANVVLLRGCGSRIKVVPFHELHGLKGCLVAPTKIIAGLGQSFDIDAQDAPGATGSYDSDFASKARTIAALLARGDCDFALLHVKAVDDTGHDRMAGMKVKFLEVVDQMVGHILAHLHDAQQQQGQQGQQQQQQQQQGTAGSGSTPKEEAARVSYAVCVTGDHSTPVAFGDHSHEPVPFALAWVEDAVGLLGGRQHLEACRPGQPIPAPDVRRPPDLQQLLQHALDQRAASDSSDGRRQQCLWDSVTEFDELAAAGGALGRFPGSQVMSLVRQFLGVAPVTCVA